MNKLGIEQRAWVISCLIEGCSIRSTVRMTDVCKRTVSRRVAEAGEACAEYHDRVMRKQTRMSEQFVTSPKCGETIKLTDAVILTTKTSPHNI